MGKVTMTKHWKPKLGQEHFIIDFVPPFTVFKTTNLNGHWDIENIKVNNYFPTRKAAQKKLLEIKKLLRQ